MTEIEKNIRKYLDEGTIEEFLTEFSGNATEILLNIVLNKIGSEYYIIHKQSKKEIDLENAMFSKAGIYQFIKNIIIEYNKYYEILLRKF